MLEIEIHNTISVVNAFPHEHSLMARLLAFKSNKYDLGLKYKIAKRLGELKRAGVNVNRGVYANVRKEIQRVEHWDGYTKFYRVHKDGLGYVPTGLLPYLIRECGTNNVKYKLFDRRGVVSSVLSMCKTKERTSEIRPLMVKGQPLRDYQIAAVDSIYTNFLPSDLANPIWFPRGIIKVATAGGKTGIIAETIFRFLGSRKQGGPHQAIVLVHTKDLLWQTREELETILQRPVGVIGDGEISTECEIVVSTVQTLSDTAYFKSVLQHCEALISDECFSAGTKIATKRGSKTIQEVVTGDLVRAFNNQLGKIVYKKVIRTFKRKPNNLLVVTLTNGATLTCTPEHPFLTSGGWVPAGKLDSSKMVCYTTFDEKETRLPLHRMHKPDYARRESKIISPTIQEGVLLQRVSEGLANAPMVRNYESYESSGPENYLRKNDSEESHEACSSQRKDDDQPPAYRMATDSPRGQRKGSDNPTTASSSNSWLADGSRGVNKTFNTRLPKSLQARYSKRNPKVRDRSRRAESLQQKTFGREERQSIKWVGVDSITFQKQTSDGTFGGLCPDGYVYNLEVEDVHTYIANGCVVHNCHHLSAETFRKTANACSNAIIRVGVSATPFKDDIVEIQHIRGVTGDPLFTKEAKELEEEGHITPVKFYCLPIETPKQITYKHPGIGLRTIETEALKYYDQEQGAIPGAYKVCIIRNEQRSKSIQEFVSSRREGSKTLVLVSTVEHGRLLADLLDCPFLSGKESSKVRKAALRVFGTTSRNTDNIPQCLVATTIFDEGVDSPGIDYLILAGAGKAPWKFVQRIGRGRRKQKGKKFLHVLDFLDLGHRTLREQSRARILTAEKEGYTIINVKDVKEIP